MEHAPERNHKHRIPDGELTRAVYEQERAMLIDAGIALAQEQHRDIDLATARSIASLLARGRGSPLGAFASTGRLDNTAMRTEYLPLLADPGTPPGVAEWIQRLGTLAIHRDNGDRTTWRAGDPAPTLRTTLWRQTTGDEDVGGFDFRIRGDHPSTELEPLMSRLIDLVRQHGTALRIFLDLPGVDAASDNLEESFLMTFQAEFHSRDETLRALTDLDEIEKAIEQIREQHIGGECLLAEVDEEQLWENLNEAWDIVSDGTVYYVFAK